MTNISLHKCYLSFFHYSTEECLDCFQFLAVIIRAAWLSKYPCDRKKFVLDKCLILKISWRAYLDYTGIGAFILKFVKSDS